MADALRTLGDYEKSHPTCNPGTPDRVILDRLKARFEKVARAAGIDPTRYVR